MNKPISFYENTLKFLFSGGTIQVVITIA